MNEIQFICARNESCPVYRNKLLLSPYAASAYRNLYCNDIENYLNCKRFQVIQQIGFCPDNILPNSILTIEEIVTRALTAQKKPKKRNE